MKKISTVFVVDYSTGLITNQVRPENKWVLDGEGIATIKKDGTSCIVLSGQLYRRFDRKLNKKYDRLFKKVGVDFKVESHMFKELPEGAVACVESFDPITYHWPHWVPVVKDNPADKYHLEALDNFVGELKDGQTYELVGPAFGNNNYSLTTHELWEHGIEVVEVERNFDAIKDFVIKMNEEGLVFHNKDGKMAKIRRSDFAKSKERSWNWKDAESSEFY